MLMDEPLSALDSQTRELLMDDLIALWDRTPFTAVYVTHNLAEAVRLGHQVIARALGGTTYKLKFGHHGANQPVIDRRTGRVFTTSQNHNYAVGDDIAERGGVTVTYVNANDDTLEGFVDDTRFVECVQFHPEAAPGPHDTTFIFDRFFERVKGWGNAAAA